MKKNYFLYLIFITSSISAQVNLVGIKYVEQNNSFNMIKWNSSTPDILQEYPTNASTYLLGSSLFDANRSIYYYRSDFRLNSFNTQNNQSAVAHDETNFNSATEIDMSNGNIYTILPQNQIPSTSNPDSPYFSLTRLNIVDNSVIEMGTLQEPITAIALSEGTCYNSDTADFYFVGYDVNFQLCIYKMNTESPSFSYEKIVLPTENIPYYLSGLYFDMQANKILAIKTTFDEGTELTNREIVQINPENGTLTTLYAFNVLATIQNGSTTFDQATRSYILITIDQNLNRNLFLYNTVTNSSIETVLPENVGEIEADNTNFSALRYTTLSNENFTKDSVKVYPIPSKNSLTVETGLSDSSTISLVGIDGKVCYKNEFNSQKIDLNVSNIPPGIYTLRIENKLGVITKKIIKE